MIPLGLFFVFLIFVTSWSEQRLSGIMHHLSKLSIVRPIVHPQNKVPLTVHGEWHVCPDESRTTASRMHPPVFAITRQNLHVGFKSGKYLGAVRIFR